jgi:hypothetical protein
MARAALLHRLARTGPTSREGPASTLPMLTGHWRSEGFVEDVEHLLPRTPGGVRMPAPLRRGQRWQRAALALLPLVSVAVGAILWMSLPA